MTIKLVPPNHTPVETLTVEMRYDDDGEGGVIPAIYYDGICVAWISDRDGSITACKLETGPYDCGGPDGDVALLKSKGVMLLIVDEIVSARGTYIGYQVEFENA